ncbi:uncharacterized protein MONOS_16896 [Monocercomonoides exilis]|uniref:uncharacterized protein n=1 Tax=Monocercomonoides exilis TaxID=2049356 RepID=UPI003559DF86|nr:hypothetical protein MONOS_16895 [Monocercomonoides exilis]KAH7832706.1 hypothetical protein MONOS_16896 [Monocercomonoides exilis]
MRLTSEFMSLVFADGASVINGELQLEETSPKTTSAVSISRLKFVFEPEFVSSHTIFLFYEGGLLEVTTAHSAPKSQRELENMCNRAFHSALCETREVNACLRAAWYQIFHS